MQFLKAKLEEIHDSLLFLAVGVMIGLAQCYVEFTSRGEPTPMRLAIARATATGGLSMSAGAVYIWYPQAPLIALLGVAAFIASIGTTMIENLLVRWVEGRK